MGKIKDKFDTRCGINGKIIETHYLYCLEDGNKCISYVGVTKDITATHRRHYKKIIENSLTFSVIGEFYDRELAEYIEMTLIHKLESQGQMLLNKINGFL